MGTLWEGVVGRTLLLTAGAAIGANARYWFGAWAQSRLGGNFPWATLAVNVSGSLVFGFVIGFIGTKGGSATAWVRLWLASGLLSSYTTFSLFSFETLSLLRTGDVGAAAANVAASVGLGLLAVWLGFAAGGAL